MKTKILIAIAVAALFAGCDKAYWSGEEYRATPFPPPTEQQIQERAQQQAQIAADVAAREKQRQDWEKQRQDFSDTQDRIMKTIRESKVGTELNLPKNWSTPLPYGQQWVLVNYNADGSSTWRRIK
jgi:hypothetical protein